MLWVRLIEKGSKLVIFQHGGVYGMAKYSFHEKLERSISDRFYTWGWTDNKKETTIPIGFDVLEKQSKYTRNPRGHLLIVGLSVGRYRYIASSEEASSEILTNLDRQFQFFSMLKKNIGDNTRVRLYKEDYGWKINERWMQKFSKIIFDDGNKKISETARSARLIVYTYNSTGILESFALNKPAILLIGKNLKLRSSAISLVMKLKEQNVIFDDPVLAAKFINNIWDDIDNWWNNYKLQEALSQFRHQYCRTNNKYFMDAIKLHKL